MARCSGVKKPNCVAPCEWVPGKGCKRGATPAPAPPKSPSGRAYAFLGFKDDELKAAVEAMNNTVSYGIKAGSTHVVYKKDKRVMDKVEAFSGKKLELGAFLERYGFSSKKVPKVAKPAPKAPSPAAKPPSKPAGCVPSKLKKYTDRKAPPYPAAECCGVTLKGNDGKEYVSKPDKNGICKWYTAKPAAKPAPKAASIAKPAAKPPSPAKPAPKPPTPEPTYKLTQLVRGKRVAAEGSDLSGKAELEYDRYSLQKIYKHAKAACLGMFKEDNDIRGVVPGAFYYVPSADLFVIALKARSDADRKDKDLNTVYGVEFTYDPKRKYMIEVDKNAMVLLDSIHAGEKALLKATGEALRAEYTDAVVLPA